MTVSQALSERVNQLLKTRNITQYRLSLLSGVPQSSISDIRNMRNKTVSVKLLYELAAGLNMSLAEFFDSPLFRDHNICD